jgi:hypothetical protein
LTGEECGRDRWATPQRDHEALSKGCPLYFGIASARPKNISGGKCFIPPNNRQLV